jgi:hypothetical protein
MHHSVETHQTNIQLFINNHHNIQSKEINQLIELDLNNTLINH